MNSKNEISNAVALFATGLLAGTFFYVRFNIVPTFWEVPTDVHLRFRFTLMKYNDVVFKSLIITAIISSVWFTWRIRLLKHIFIFTGFAVILAITTFLITYFGTMPINSQISTWLQTSPPQNWITILKTWDFYHTCRTATAIGSFIMILIATFFKKQLLKKQLS
ncbi:MAG: DUF1772 domain-containing protein [Bacteroidota bacterium]